MFTNRHLTFDQAQATYTKYQSTRKSHTPGTSSAYTTSYNHVVEYWSEVFNGKTFYVSQMTGSSVWEGYWSWRSKEVSGRVYNRELRHVKGLFQWLVGEGYIPKNPVKDYEPKRSPGAVRRKSYQESEDLEATAEAARERFGDVGWMFIVFSFYSMLRASQISTIRIRDIDFRPSGKAQYGTISYIGLKHEHNTRKTIDIPYPLVEPLRHYIENVYPTMIDEPMDKEFFLFPARRKGYNKNNGFRKVNPRKQDHLLRVIAGRSYRDLGVYEEGMGAHTLRRGGGKDLRKRGADIRILQAAFGHQKQETTEEYMDEEYERQQLAERRAEIYGPQKPTMKGMLVKESEEEAVVSLGENVISFEELQKRRRQA